MRGLPSAIVRYSYERDAQACGIVHFGIGAFHRAHQAWYTDRAMDAGDRDWAICGVSLRSDSVARQLNPQDGLYTLTQREGAAEVTRVIGAVREVLVAGRERDAVVARIASPQCHIVSFTVTEKGYARATDGGLDFGAAHSSFYPLLTEGLARRKNAGLPGITLLSCDNLAHNGAQLDRLFTLWLEREAPHLAEWYARNCTCPATMVDRIVPASSDADLARVQAKLGVEDRGAVFAERFSQWVIEDRFAGPRPGWDALGVQFVSDAAPYETAKLRMLNGAHSALAYCGLRRGFAFVYEAMADSDLRALAAGLMSDSAAPTIARARDQDLKAYARVLLDRFADPALNHRLAQVAMDGTQKIPQRWLDTLAWHIARGQRCPAIEQAFDAWVWHLSDGRFVEDPLGDRLQAIHASGGRPALLSALFDTDAGRPVWPGYGGCENVLRRGADGD